MTAVPEAAPGVRASIGRAGPPIALAAAAFVVLFAQPTQLLFRDWWTDSEAGHGLLLAPLAVWLVWRDQPAKPCKPNAMLGTTLLVAAVLLRYLAGLAAGGG